MKKGLTTPFGGIRSAACTLLRKDAWLCRRPLFPRTLLLLLCLFRQSEAQPAGWAFLIPLRHSSFSPQSFAAQTFAGAPPYGLMRKAGIHFITPTQDKLTNRRQVIGNIDPLSPVPALLRLSARRRSG